jgi:DNA-binding PadR family transcriptional regulator
MEVGINFMQPVGNEQIMLVSGCWQAILSAKLEIIKTMKRTYLGEFEEIVLLAVVVMEGQAYGLVILNEITAQTGRDLRLNQVHSALMRLEEKGMVKSTLGEPTAERGGKRKRLFTITAYGQRTLQEIQQVRDNFWSRLLNPLKLTSGI